MIVATSRQFGPRSLAVILSDPRNSHEEAEDDIAKHEQAVARPFLSSSAT